VFERNPLTVKDGRGRRRGAASSFSNTIKMPKWTRLKWYIMHELAHIATDYLHNFHYDEDDEDGGGWPGYTDPETGLGTLTQNVAHHGPEFAGIYLYLLRELVGAQAHDKLQAAFEETRVKDTPAELAMYAATIAAVTDTDTGPVATAVTDTDTRCLECGMALSPGASRTFCSDKCRWTHHNRERHHRSAAGREKTCEVCDKEFTAARSDAKTCSPKCRQKARRASQRARSAGVA
jgi:predicted nucleic acid-binding Zn ribbon protein